MAIVGWDRIGHCGDHVIGRNDGFVEVLCPTGNGLAEEQ